MANFYDDNDDLRWYVDKGIDWEPIVRLTEYDYKAEDGFTNVDDALEFYREILSLVGGFVADEIAPRWAELDDAHPTCVDGEVIEKPVWTEIFGQLADMELHGLCVPRELGGMNAPLIMMQMNIELLSRADVSVAAHHSFHMGIAMAALSYSLREGSTTYQVDPPQILETRFSQAISEIISGEAWGSMDITEPGAGSDMAAIRTRGEQDADGNWSVSGQKIFITSGHGKWHFVIARTEEDAGETEGLKGLSMFLVPAYETDEDGNKKWLATVLGVEEKLGHNGSATVSISFDKTPGMLIGERGDGFKHMLVLMNNARVGVGFEALGLSEAALRAAKAYAAERPSMGKTIDQHEMIADMLEVMDSEIRATRAMTVTAAWHEELAQKLDLMLQRVPPDDEAEREAFVKQKERHARKARHLTPLLKWFGGEKAVDIARNAIQIHGGSGYIKESGVEKLLRDAMVFPIYEGTTQIQALMAMKDNLVDAIKRPAAFVRRTANARWKQVSARDPLERRVATLRLTAQQTIQFLLSRLAAAKVKELRNHDPSDWTTVFTTFDPKRDFALAMLHADRLASILTDAAVAELFYAQIKKDPAREEHLLNWLERAEPRTRFKYDEITTTGLRLLKKLSPDVDEDEDDDAKRAAAK